MSNLTPSQRAVDAAGSISALARKLGIAHQVCHRWVKRGYFPPARALEIELYYGIPARDLVKPALLEIAELITS